MIYTRRAKDARAVASRTYAGRGSRPQDKKRGPPRYSIIRHMKPDLITLIPERQ